MLCGCQTRNHWSSCSSFCKYSKSNAVGNLLRCALWSDCKQILAQLTFPQHLTLRIQHLDCRGGVRIKSSDIKLSKVSSSVLKCQHFRRRFKVPHSGRGDNDYRMWSQVMECSQCYPMLWKEPCLLHVCHYFLISWEASVSRAVCCIQRHLAHSVWRRARTLGWAQVQRKQSGAVKNSPDASESLRQIACSLCCAAAN